MTKLTKFGSFGHLDPFKKQGLPCLRTHVALADTANSSAFGL